MPDKKGGEPQVTPVEPEERGSGRDPEERSVQREKLRRRRWIKLSPIRFLPAIHRPRFPIPARMIRRRRKLKLPENPSCVLPNRGTFH